MAEEKNLAGSEAESQENEAGKQGKKGRMTLLLIGLGILVVGAIGIGVAFFFSGGLDQSRDDDFVSAVEQSRERTGDMPRDERRAGETESVGTAPVAAEVSRQGGEEGRSRRSGSSASAAIDFGETYQMKTFQLNLGNALENRYVRLEVTLEYSGGESQKREIDQRLPQLRDAIISIVSRKTREFLLAPDGKDALRKEILIRINRYMKTKIDAVYITDILIE